MRGVRVLYSHATLLANPGERIGLVGENGCGKSSLLAAILGEIPIEAGEISAPDFQHIGHVAQDIDTVDEVAIDWVLSGHAPLVAAKKALEEATDDMATAQALATLAELNEGAITAQAKIILHGLGFTEEMIECARYARQQGARVIAITRIGNDAGLARQADYVLGIAADEPLIRSGAMGSRMSQMVMIDALYAVCVAKDFERCSALIRRNYTVKEDPEGRRKASKERKGGSDARSDKTDH